MYNYSEINIFSAQECFHRFLFCVPNKTNQAMFFNLLFQNPFGIRCCIIPIWETHLFWPRLDVPLIIHFAQCGMEKTNDLTGGTCLRGTLHRGVMWQGNYAPFTSKLSLLIQQTTSVHHIGRGEVLCPTAEGDDRRYCSFTNTLKGRRPDWATSFVLVFVWSLIGVCKCDVHN